MLKNIVNRIEKYFDRLANDNHERIKIKIQLLQTDRNFMRMQGFPLHDIDKIDKKIRQYQKKLNKGRQI